VSPAFQPPTADEVPPVDSGAHPWPTGPAQWRLFSHYKSRARGVTVVLKTDGTCVTVQYPAQLTYSENTPASSFAEQGLADIPYSDIARVFTGGHVHYVTDAEAAALLACGGHVSHSCGWGECPWGEDFYGG